ncbi:hypothetical protein Leryth_005280 [Lithospermum erythrorhizon]|nr:hypothetical protein Leryth_005280 [Lithospermum erythrorhizon]
MVSNSSSLLFLCALSLLLPLISSTSTIPLSFFQPSSIKDPYQTMSHLASLSIARAHHIKFPHKPFISTTPLSPHSYGDYSISLKFGTPPQSIPFIMDTGTFAQYSIWYKEIPACCYQRCIISVQISLHESKKCTGFYNTTDPEKIYPISILARFHKWVNKKFLKFWVGCSFFYSSTCWNCWFWSWAFFNSKSTRPQERTNR